MCLGPSDLIRRRWIRQWRSCFVAGFVPAGQRKVKGKSVEETPKCGLRFPLGFPTPFQVERGPTQDTFLATTSTRWLFDFPSWNVWLSDIDHKRVRGGGGGMASTWRCLGSMFNVSVASFRVQNCPKQALLGILSCRPCGENISLLSHLRSPAKKARQINKQD